MAYIYLALLTLFLIIGIGLCKIKINNRLQNVLSPKLVLIISYYMYSVAMPISRLFYNTGDLGYDSEYIWMQTLGALGLIIGLCLHKYWYRYSENSETHLFAQKYLSIPAVIIMTIAVSVVMILAFKDLGWDLRAVFNSRSYAASLQTESPEQTLFGAILWVLAISSTVLAFIGAHADKNRKLLLFILWVVGLFSTFFLLRGARLLVGMLILPLLCTYLYSKPITKKALLLSCLSIFFLVYMIGLVRDVGFSQLSDVSMEIKEFDPLTQELGTNYSVFTKWRAMDQNLPLIYGKSYTKDLLYNMVPRYFWPGRPDTAAVQFSMDYYGVSAANELTSAFGFSPIVEALINFGVIGIVPVFALFALLIGGLENWFMQKKAWGIACYAFMIPMVINWNRMDMAITFKMFIIYLVVSKIFAALMYRTKNIDFAPVRTAIQ